MWIKKGVLFPDYQTGDYGESSYGGNYQIPEELWDDYLDTRRRFMAIRRELTKLFEQQGGRP